MYFQHLTLKVAMFTTLVIAFSLAQARETFTTKLSNTTINSVATPSEPTSGPLEPTQLLVGSSNFGENWRRDEEEPRVVSKFDLADKNQQFSSHPIVPHYYLEKYDGKIPYVLTPEFFEKEFGNVRREFSILLTPHKAEQYLSKANQGTEIIPEKTGSSNQYQGPYYYLEKYDGKIPYLFTPAEFKSFFGEEKGTFTILLTLGESRQWLSKYKGKFRNPIYTMDKGASNEETVSEPEKVASNSKETTAEEELATDEKPATEEEPTDEESTPEEKFVPEEDHYTERISPEEASPGEIDSKPEVAPEEPVAKEMATESEQFAIKEPVAESDEPPAEELDADKLPADEAAVEGPNVESQEEELVAATSAPTVLPTNLSSFVPESINSSQDEDSTLDPGEVIKALKELETEGKMTSDIARKIIRNSDQLTHEFQSALKLENGEDGIFKGARAVVSGWLMFFHLMKKGVIPYIPSFREVEEILELPKVIQAAGVQSMEVASPAIEKGIEVMFGPASLAAVTSAEQVAVSVLGAQMAGALGPEEYEAFSTGVADGDPALEATLDQILNTGQPNLETGQPNLETSQPNLETGQPNLETSQPNLETGQPNLETGQPNLETSDPISEGTNELVELLRQNGQRLEQLVKNTSSTWLDKLIKYSGWGGSAIGAGAAAGAIIERVSKAQHPALPATVTVVSVWSQPAIFIVTLQPIIINTIQLPTALGPLNTLIASLLLVAPLAMETGAAKANITSAVPEHMSNFSSAQTSSSGSVSELSESVNSSPEMVLPQNSAAITTAPKAQITSSIFEDVGDFSSVPTFSSAEVSELLESADSSLGMMFFQNSAAMTTAQKTRITSALSENLSDISAIPTFSSAAVRELSESDKKSVENLFLQNSAAIATAPPVAFDQSKSGFVTSYTLTPSPSDSSLSVLDSKLATALNRNGILANSTIPALNSTNFGTKSTRPPFNPTQFWTKFLVFVLP